MKERKISHTSAVDFLVYASYKANRNLAPHISPERWEAIFGDITELELRFQNEHLSTLIPSVS